MQFDEQPSSPVPIDDDERAAPALNGNPEDGVGINSPLAGWAFIGAAVVAAIVAGCLLT
jgi:hypothetical protein